MKVSHIEHLGIAVKNLEEAIPYWENVLGLKCYAIEEVDNFVEILKVVDEATSDEEIMDYFKDNTVL